MSSLATRLIKARTVRRAKVLQYLSPSLLLTLVALVLADQRPVPLLPAHGAAAIVFACGVLAGLAGEAMINRRDSSRRSLEAGQLGDAVRSGMRDLLLLSFVAVTPAADQPTFVLMLLAAVIVTGVRVGHHLFRSGISTIRARSVGWRNLDLEDIVETQRAFRRFLARVPSVLTSASAAIALVFCGTVLGLDRVWLVAVVVIAAAYGVLVLVFNGVDLARATALSSNDHMIAAVAERLADFEPTVLLYYSRPEKAGYIANVWIPTLEEIDHRVMVLVRESHNLGQIKTDEIPVVQVSRTGDIERVLPESVQIALYPSNVATNNHLLRLPGIVDVFIGHGDSDKGGSATTLSRIYDEVWVSGPAAQDRYRVARVGVRDEQIRQVGRPQLAEITGAAELSVEEEAAHEFDYTVLYAPTREGFYAEWEYSSILTQGEQILAGLFGIPGVRVLFKPHPGTGTDNPQYKKEVRRLARLVRSQGPPHEVVEHGQALYAAFNRADLLVSDVSSVITDFLASAKPYVVTSSSLDSAEDFRSTYPSSGGAYILSGEGDELADFVADARERDSLRERREQCAGYLLGLTSEDPVQRFDHAITDAVERFAPTYRASQQPS